MRINRNAKGFTLVELLVVIAIIGLLATVVIISVGSARGKARDGRRISDMKALQGAMELYKDGNSGNAVAAQNGLSAALTPTYLGAIPSDPKTNAAYTYSNAGSDDTYYFQFTTEQDSSLGDAGAFCANSNSVEAAVSGSCTER